ncbi:hypothetical protein AJ79_09752 [Helicocarpus griseus UAMH5409]|uniref:Nephrocystin 3-like N-terminal domain-containing protein n=1 Tax=Helicocarpus griseus UAMH5409 TaxID=1447875 RepID=A0A2B7WHN4_9EURO|nr:hypothetical protein AJ79_09752 [Helicocarpus griseus UAMH5409]
MLSTARNQVPRERGESSTLMATSSSDKRMWSEENDGSSPDDTKRRRTADDDEADSREHGQKGGLIEPKNTDYTVGWICALLTEMAAAIAMLDNVHKNLPTAEKDSNAYILGNIGPHNIVIACLPANQYGTINAASVGSNIDKSFPSIRVRLMVGVGGGVPGEVDLRLGDIVVGWKVTQYDIGKVTGDGQMKQTGFPRIPPAEYLTAVNKLRAIHETTPSRVPSILQDMLKKRPRMAHYACPANSEDRLFRADYDHDSSRPSCDKCDMSKLVNRPPRTNHDPMIHYGGIASGNQVMKHGKTRDKIAENNDIICFEMEAAGLIDTFPCLVIRGICDYSNSHKNKEWQPYAAAVAAAYAKEWLAVMPSAGMETVTRKDTAPGVGTFKPGAFSGVCSSFPIGSRQSEIKVAHAKTCNWLLEHPLYLDWLDSEKLVQHHGFLWIRGKPGAGKSTIMKFAYMQAKRKHGANATTASFFFNGRGGDLEKSTSGTYRSLLLQLLNGFPDLQNVLDNQELIPLDHGGCPTLDVLRELFRNAILKLGRRSFTCFVDALDECHGQQISDMKGHDADLENYVRSCLKASSDPLHEEVRAEILQRAAGVFMWVVLVVDILNKEFQRGRIFAVRKRLQEIPDQLSDIFKNIVTRDNENMEDLLLCIQWILYARRPLKKEEYYLAVLSGLSDIKLAECTTTHLTSESLDRFIVIRDFLLKDGGLRQLWPGINHDHEILSNEKLKQCCLAYLKFCLSAHVLVNIPHTTDDELVRLREIELAKFPFVQYATQHVLYHSEVAANGINQDDFIDQFPFEGWHNLLKANVLVKTASLLQSQNSLNAKYNLLNLEEIPRCRLLTLSDIKRLQRL